MAVIPFQPSKFQSCPSCAGAGRITAQRSGDWRREPHKYDPARMVPCPICGGTGLIPRKGRFDEV